MFGDDAARVVVFVKAFSPLWRIVRIIPNRNALHNAGQE